jgi:Spy/CpxP family protein refolding chaperone
MMKKKRSILVVTFVLLTMGLSPALAQQEHQHGTPPAQPPAEQIQPAPSPGPHAGPHAQMMARLTQQQQEALQSLQETKFREVYPLVLQLRAIRAQLVAELGQEKVNRNAVNQTIKEMNAIRTGIDQHRVDLVLRIKEMDLPPGIFGSMLMRHGLGGLFGRDMAEGSMAGRGMGGGMMGGGMGGMGGMGGGMGGGMRCPMMMGHGGMDNGNGAGH